MSVTVLGPVIVIELVDVLTTLTPFAAVVPSVSPHTKLVVDVKAGEMAVTTAVDGVPDTSGADP